MSDTDQRYQAWIRDEAAFYAQHDAQMQATIQTFTEIPLISILLPVYRTPLGMLQSCIDSVRRQSYPHWELCIVDDASESAELTALIAAAAASDARIKTTVAPHNGGISRATNAALAMASGEFIALLDHDDLLADWALYEIVLALNHDVSIDIFYSDSDQIDLDGQRSVPFFKPDWSIDLMLGHNLVSHLGVYRKRLADAIGGMRPDFDGSQDYDFALRAYAASASKKVKHIPKVLYHWRIDDRSYSHSRHDRCLFAARLSIAHYLIETGQPQTQVGSATLAPDWTQVRWPLAKPAPRVTVIVPTRDRADVLSRCVEGLLYATDYANLDVIIVNNDSQHVATYRVFAELMRDARVSVLDVPGAFNFSALNNRGAKHAQGEFLLLLNDDIEVMHADWLYELVSQAARLDVGAVGPVLVATNNLIQSAGLFLGVGDEQGSGIAAPIGRGHAANAIGYLGQYSLARQISAVSASCLIVKTQLYRDLGGFDDIHLPIAYGDVDFCLRLQSRGLRTIWTPFSAVRHLEANAWRREMGEDERKAARYMRAKWHTQLQDDPFYNPNFSRSNQYFDMSNYRPIDIRPGGPALSTPSDA